MQVTNRAFNIVFWSGLGLMVFLTFLGRFWAAAPNWQLLLAFVVAGYGVHVFRTSPGDKSAADSIYYLGFIFTLGSLFIALLPMVFSESTFVPQKVLQAFAVALSTTLVALIARTYVIGNSEIEAIDEDVVQQRLIAATNDLVINLNQVTVQLNETNEKIGQSFGQLVLEVTNASDRLSEGLVGLHLRVHKDLDQAATDFAVSLNRTSESASGAASSLHEFIAGSLARSEKSASAFNSTLESNVKLLQQTASAAENSRLELEKHLKKLPEEIRNAGTRSIEELKLIVRTRVDAIDEGLEKGLDSISDGLNSTIAKSFELVSDFALKVQQASTEMICEQFNEFNKAIPDFKKLTTALQKTIAAISGVEGIMLSFGSEAKQGTEGIKILRDSAKTVSDQLRIVAESSREFENAAAVVKSVSGQIGNDLVSAQTANQALNVAILQGTWETIRALETSVKGASRR